jgi:hypothetical protein
MSDRDMRVVQEALLAHEKALRRAMPRRTLVSAVFRQLFNPADLACRG